MEKFKPVFVRSANNYDMKAASDAVGFVCDRESRTQQQFKEECDINTIVRRFGVTGQVPTNIRAPIHGDFVETVDFRTAMDAIVAAREAFDQMPSGVRKRFHNDPAEFVDFCSNVDNRAEAERMGLLIPPQAPPPEPAPIAVKVVSDGISEKDLKK